MQSFDSPSFRLRFSSVLFRSGVDAQLTEMCSALDVAGIRDVSKSFVHLDLTSVTFIHLDAACWLVVLIRALRDNGNEVLLSLPETDNTERDYVWSFLLRWRFFDALRRTPGLMENVLSHAQLVNAFQGSHYKQAMGYDEWGKRVPEFSQRLLPITALNFDPTEYEDSIGGVLERYADLIVVGGLVTACGVDHDDAASLVSFFVSEAIYNAADHSNGARGYIGMQVIPPKLARVGRVNPALVISVVDDGIGIPEVLRAAKDQGRITLDDLPADDATLIQRFTQFSVLSDSLIVESSTRKGLRSERSRRGLGLYEARRTAVVLGATMRVRSGRAEVVFEPDGSFEATDHYTNSPGTVIKLEVPLARHLRNL